MNRDLKDAVDHVSAWGDFDLSEFNKHTIGSVDIEKLEYYEDMDRWIDFEHGELANASDEEIEEALTKFRDASFAERALGWIKSKKFPPIVLVGFPNEEDDSGFGAEIGDGRGRINVATAMGIKKLPLIYLVHKSMPEELGLTELTLDEVKKQNFSHLLNTSFGWDCPGFSF